MIELKHAYYNGMVNLDKKIKGSGNVQGYSWCLSSTSTTLIVEIAEDQAIDSDNLPLVGYGCSGWIYEQPLSDNLDVIKAVVHTAMMLFRENKIAYFPAVTCSCSDL